MVIFSLTNQGRVVIILWCGTVYRIGNWKEGWCRREPNTTLSAIQFRSVRVFQFLNPTHLLLQLWWTGSIHTHHFRSLSS